MADKQLKANMKFMEEQAIERENERDEFNKEVEKLRIYLKEKDKDKNSHENYEKEVNFNHFNFFVDNTKIPFLFQIFTLLALSARCSKIIAQNSYFCM